MIDHYVGLSIEQKEHFREVMARHFKDLEHEEREALTYELAVVVYGECLTTEEAEHIVSKMYGHGASGEHWTLDEIKSLAHNKGIEFEKEHYSLGDLYAIMHAEYYDHYEFICSLTSDHSRIAEYSFKLAHGYLNDEDAPDKGKGKARKYFHFVV